MFGNMGKIMKIAAEMKTRLPEMKQRLAESEYSAQAGGSAVAATVNGKLQVIELTIDPAVLSDESLDSEMLADLIKAAIASAQQQAIEAAEAAMKELTGGMDLPGLDALMG